MLVLVLAAAATAALVLPRPPRERRDPPRARAQAENHGSRRGAPRSRDRIRRRALQARGMHQETRRTRRRNASGAPVYEYDALGNLRGVTLPNGDVITYLVDGMGRRVGKEVNGVLVQGWLWRGRLQPVAELDGAGNVVARYVYLRGNVPSLMVTGSATYRLVKDHLGSVRQVVDVATGAVAEEILYDSWGRVLVDTNPGFQPFGFVGGLLDVDTGFSRFGARDYGAETGTWTRGDPLHFPAGGLNRFSYAADDPINRADVRGLETPGGEGAGAACGQAGEASCGSGASTAGYFDDSGSFVGDEDQGAGTPDSNGTSWIGDIAGAVGYVVGGFLGSEGCTPYRDKRQKKCRDYSNCKNLSSLACAVCCNEACDPGREYDADFLLCTSACPRQ